MKKLTNLLILGLFLIMLGCQKDSLVDMPNLTKDGASFRSDDIPETEIKAGIDWLVVQQNPDGSFGSQEYVAVTSLVVTKLCEYSKENNQDPKTGDYATEIIDGLNYIFSKGYTGPCNGDYPEGTLYFTAGGHHTYNTGIAMMAISSFGYPGDPVTIGGNTMTHKDAVQAAVNFFDCIQSTTSPHTGGWAYAPGLYYTPDQSNTGFAVLGLLAAEEFSCTIDQQLKDDLSLYIDYTQNDVDGDTHDGGGGYTNPDSWVNSLKTGNLLFEMAFVGDELGDQRVLDAIDYIERHWNDPGGDGNPGYYGWEGQYLAMYCMMKGFLAMGIEEVDPEGPVGLIPWYTAFKDDILPDQLGDGSWPANPRWLDYPIESTVFNLLTLEKFAPLPVIQVEFDIKPGSCPNPFNMKANGLLPVAVLGTADFDVSEIDPGTVTLEGVSPVKWNNEDVATPVTNPQTDCECTTDGPDGYMDKTFKFSHQELVANAPALQGVDDGDEVPMTISGELISGQSFTGVDCVVIIKKGKK